MKDITAQTYSAFEGHRLFAQGSLEEVVLKLKKRTAKDPGAMLLVFSNATGKVMDFDLSGTEKEVLKRLQVFTTPATEESPTANAGPGRPKLGVVAREVSLLPRHWEWLATQPGGASATLRRLVDEAKKSTQSKDVIKQAQEATYRFMSAIAGDLPNYEEALRSLYAKDEKTFKSHVREWPDDIKDLLKKFSKEVFT